MCFFFYDVYIAHWLITSSSKLFYEHYACDHKITDIIVVSVATTFIWILFSSAFMLTTLCWLRQRLWYNEWLLANQQTDKQILFFFLHYNWSEPRGWERERKRDCNDRTCITYHTLKQRLHILLLFLLVCSFICLLVATLIVLFGFCYYFQHFFHWFLIQRY